MTAPRQRKQCRRVSLSAALCLLPAALFAAESKVSSDPQSGLAISGFDPVAYFSDASPVLGKAGYEHRGDDGATWRFANEGNRAAFAGHPEIYAPRFGGYDPVAAARGASVAGHPQIWLISGERLYLFFSVAARDAFAAEPQRFIGAAERNWPQLIKTIP